MGPHFDALGVALVAISPDTLRESSRGKRRSNLTMQVLADPELKVIDLYGLRHEHAMGGPRDGSLIRNLAIPTSVLIDADGVVRWIDQADDYRVRSDADRVLDAVRRHLPGDPPASA
ncbi:MAG: redoxin domain-containing protein [Deltaproteobacteria bacterium]|nr:redoxin domain-containing protein [Deltaproteobacteria bacterium]MBW2416910.1 redoxin domain-containing protein [Deltaproteobacteria bacterium]